MPLTSVVLPAPRSPRRTTIFGGESVSASERPRVIVSSGQRGMNSRVSVTVGDQYSERLNRSAGGLSVSLRRDPLRGTQSQKILVNTGIEGVAQSEVIFVFEGDEAKWLQGSILEFARRLQDFRHGFHVARCGLNGDLDQIALLQRSSQSQHAAGFGNGLQLRSRAMPIIQLDNHGYRTLELNSLRAVLRVSLGEVCHSQIHYVMSCESKADYRSACLNSSSASLAGPVLTAQMAVPSLYQIQLRRVIGR